VTKDVEGNTIATWQSALQKIANAASLDRDLSLDVYHESVSNSILQAMDLLKVNGSFKPLEEYQRQYQQQAKNALHISFLLKWKCGIIIPYYKANARISWYFAGCTTRCCGLPKEGDFFGCFSPIECRCFREKTVI
jgi:hypothetical protein